jgi:hypothetical protein
VTVVTIPITTYSVREGKPTTQFGSPAVVLAKSGTTTDSRIIARVPLDQIPLDATIVSAILRFTSKAAAAGSIPARVYPNTEPWKSKVTWSTRPSVGAVIATTTKVAPSATAVWEWDVTAWAGTRVRQGLTLDVNSTTLLRLRGSAATSGKPVLVVTYTVPPQVPSAQKPSGGAVSVAQPVLTYAGDEDMTEQWVEYSTDGTVGTTVYQSGWLPASRGYYDPTADPGTGVGKTGVLPNPAGGGEIYWRVRTNGPDGISTFSGWLSYIYEPIVDPVPTNPPATTDDGTPPFTWTVAVQTSWRAFFYDENGLIEDSGWRDEPDTRTWTPQRGVPVPDGHGRYLLWTTDDVLPRVSAEGAPTHGIAEVTFDTVLTGSADAINTLDIWHEEPITLFSGTRSLGTPDEVALVRDGVIVPIWAEDGASYLWAPGDLFFEGTEFAITDYTANPRHQHTWSIRTRAGGNTSSTGPTLTRTFNTGSVWLVDPDTGEKVEIFGYNSAPVVEQGVAESAALHTPVSGALVVEQVRRRLARTTRFGGISGMVVNDAEGILQGWAERDSGHRYRLIFGKVNWSVIIGDYNPSDVFYSEECGDDMLRFEMNWWERLSH